ARITAFISLPGRYLVYMPQARHIGVSRRIRDERERDRLRAALRAIPLPPGGFILRTNAEGKGEAEFANDIEFLSRLWAQIQARFESAEALVSIDVNTGKYVGKRDFEQTVLKINLEAVGEVVRQIRLRDLGGIIIIDFIDMEREEHREQVFKALKRALAEDKARTNVLQI